MLAIPGGDPSDPLILYGVFIYPITRLHVTYLNVLMMMMMMMIIIIIIIIKKYLYSAIESGYTEVQRNRTLFKVRPNTSYSFDCTLLASILKEALAIF